MKIPTPLTVKTGTFISIQCPRGSVCEMTAGYEQTRLQDAYAIVDACNAYEELMSIAQRLSSLAPSSEGLGGCAPLSAFIQLASEAREALSVIKEGG